MKNTYYPYMNIISIDKPYNHRLPLKLI